MVNSSTRVTAIFGALADPTRRRMLASLSRGGEQPEATLRRPFRMSAPAISKHLRVLEKAGLIHRRRRGREHWIRRRSEGLKPAQDWMAHCAAGWEFSFDALENLVRKEKRK